MEECTIPKCSVVPDKPWTPAGGRCPGLVRDNASMGGFPPCGAFLSPRPAASPRAGLSVTVLTTQPARRRYLWPEGRCPGRVRDSATKLGSSPEFGASVLTLLSPVFPYPC
jgi:hypothetical protein